MAVLSLDRINLVSANQSRVSAPPTLSVTVSLQNDLLFNTFVTNINIMSHVFL